MTAKTQTAKALANFDEESKRSILGDNDQQNHYLGINSRNNSPEKTNSAVDHANRRNSSYLMSDMRNSHQGDDIKNNRSAEQNQMKARGSPDLKGDYDIEEVTTDNKNQ